MKKAIVIIITIICGYFGWAACKKGNVVQPKSEQHSDSSTVPLSGHYVWKFEIPNIGSQESHMIFYTDSIGYIMSGPAYATNYMMIQENYTEKDGEKRWIGTGKGGSIPKDGVYFVIFFKDITDSTVTIYKHECGNGKKEAENFAYPETNVTADHGWNVYYKK